MSKNSDNSKDILNDVYKKASDAYQKGREVITEVQKDENDPNGYFKSCFKNGAIGAGVGAGAGLFLPKVGIPMTAVFGGVCGCAYGLYDRYNEINPKK